MKQTFLAYKPRPNMFMPYANNKDADQPSNPRRLFSAFDVCCRDSIKPIVAVSEIPRTLLSSVTEQAGSSLTW